MHFMVDEHGSWYLKHIIKVYIYMSALVRKGMHVPYAYVKSDYV